MSISEYRSQPASILMSATGYLTTSDALYYTAPAGGAILQEIVLTNVTGTSAYARVNLVPLAGSSSEANRIISDGEIPPGATVIFSLSTVMPASSMIRALAETASAITITISGITIT